MKVINVKIPEYKSEQSPDFSKIGAKLDDILKEDFSGMWVAVRGVSLQDHPGRSLSWLVEKIKEVGTDRYDLQRKGVHDNLDKKFGIDTHAVPMMYKDEMVCPHYGGERCKTGSAIGELLNDCHGGAVVDRGYSLWIDVLLLYDLGQLAPAPLVWTDVGPTHTNSPVSLQETCEFRFKNPADKKGALLGLISIER